MRAVARSGPSPSTSKATKITGTSAQDRRRRRLPAEPRLEGEERQHGRRPASARSSPSRMPSQPRSPRPPRRSPGTGRRSRGGRGCRAGRRRRARWSWARMPSYLSSTQTVGPEPLHDLGGVLGRRREHELDRVEEREARLGEPVVAGELGHPADVAGEHAGPLHRRRAAGRTPSRSPPRRGPRGARSGARRTRTLTTYLAVSGSHRARSSREDRRSSPRARTPPRSRRRPRRPRCSVGDSVGSGVVTGERQDVLDRLAQVRRPVVRLAERGSRHAGEVGDGRRDRRPAEPGGPLVGLGERPAGQEDDGDRAAPSGDRSGEVRRRGGRSSRRSGWWRRRARRPRSSDAWRRWYTVAADGPPTLVSRRADGRTRRPPAPRAGEPRRVPSAGTATRRSPA